jgi:aminoglycoside phosphotransferase (APT) family kinase protein
VLSYIEGDVPADLGFHDEETLRKAAALIRRYHDLTAALVTTSAAYAVGVEIICHNNLSPCNFVFRAGEPVAIIDFDAAAPGSRLYDLGYAAWLWLDLGSANIAPPQQGRRLALFARAYGMSDPGSVLASVIERQQVLVAQGERLGNTEMADWAAACLEWTNHHYKDLQTG